MIDYTRLPLPRKSKVELTSMLIMVFSAVFASVVYGAAVREDQALSELVQQLSPLATNKQGSKAEGGLRAMAGTGADAHDPLVFRHRYHSHDPHTDHLIYYGALPQPILPRRAHLVRSEAFL